MNQIFVWAGQLTCASNVYIDVTMEVNEFLPAGARIKMILTFYFTFMLAYIPQKENESVFQGVPTQSFNLCSFVLNKGF